MRPTSVHRATTWLQVSLRIWQLWLFVLWLSWCKRNFMVPVMPRMCLDAHTWKRWGTEWRVSWTDREHTLSKPSVLRIFFHSNRAFGNCWCRWKHIYSAMSNKNLFPLMKNPRGSRGRRRLVFCCVIANLLTHCLARWSQTFDWVWKNLHYQLGELWHGSTIKWMKGLNNSPVCFWGCQGACIKREFGMLGDGPYASVPPGSLTLFLQNQLEWCALC